jgi:hypothetical protein
VFSYRVQKIFGDLLNVVNMVRFRCVSNLLLLATLPAVDKFLSGYKRKDRGNKVGSSNDNE